MYIFMPVYTYTDIKFVFINLYQREYYLHN